MEKNYNQQKSVIHEACKNFSLLDKEGIGYTLSPAYDLLAVALIGIADKDELAMLSTDLKEAYRNLINERIERIS